MGDAARHRVDRSGGLALTDRAAHLRPPLVLVWQSFNLFARDVFQLKISGVEKLPAAGPFILCANHQSYLDAPVLTAATRRHFRDFFYVGDSEKFGSGPARSVARFLRLIPVDPDANLVPATRGPGAYGLRHGKILVLYPEGRPGRLFQSVAARPSFQRFSCCCISLWDLIYPYTPLNHRKRPTTP